MRPADPEMPSPVLPRGRGRPSGEPAIAAMLERHGRLLYGLLTVAFVCLFAAAARFLTLEPDEAWILLSTAHAFGVPTPYTVEFGAPTITTGGPYLLAHGPLARITMDLLAHRAVSLIAAVALIGMVYRVMRRLGHPAWRGAVAASLFAATPGFLLQAGMATGEVIAVLFLVAGAIHWVERGGTTAGGAALTGLLLGSACAARVNCAAALPAFAMFALVMSGADRRTLGRVALALAVAATVTALSAASYYLAEHDPAHAAYLAKATGLGRSGKSIASLIRAIDMANTYLPIPLVAAAFAGWMTLHHSEPTRPADAPAAKVRDMAGMLLFIGIAMLVAWVLIAPFPHLRYLWPAIACIWLAGIMLLLELWRRVTSPMTSLGLHMLVWAVALHGLLVGVQDVTIGESSVLVQHAMDTSPQLTIERSHRLHAAANQRALAAFVARQPANARFLSFVPFFTYPITYLSGRTILPASDPVTTGRILLMLPVFYTVERPSLDFDRWRRSYATLVFRSGNVAAFRIADGAPPPPPRMYFSGENDLY